MAYNEELADRIRISLDGQEGVVERKMFGGVAFMIHGNMCCGVVNDDLMVRVGPDHTSKPRWPCPTPGPWILRGGP